jgi:hypothetical protein
MERIEEGEKTLAIIDNVDNFKEGLFFYGSPLDYIQIGAFNYDEGKILNDHVHKFRPKLAHKTQEIMVVFSGAISVRTFGEDGELVSVHILKPGDFYISYWGGCGFTVLEDNTRMLEVKNGPHDVNNDDEDRILL